MIFLGENDLGKKKKITYEKITITAEVMEYSSVVN